MKKKIVLVSSVLIFCIFVWAAAMHHTSSVMDVSRISEQAYQKIRDKRTEMVDPSRAKLFVNGVEAAWGTDRRAVLYFPEPVGRILEGCPDPPRWTVRRSLLYLKKMMDSRI